MTSIDALLSAFSSKYSQTTFEVFKIELNILLKLSFQNILKYKHFEKWNINYTDFNFSEVKAVLTIDRTVFHSSSLIKVSHLSIGSATNPSKVF